jgi:hypothetical protein
MVNKVSEDLNPLILGNKYCVLLALNIRWMMNNPTFLNPDILTITACYSIARHIGLSS